MTLSVLLWLKLSSCWYHHFLPSALTHCPHWLSSLIAHTGCAIAPPHLLPSHIGLTHCPPHLLLLLPSFTAGEGRWSPTGLFACLCRMISCDKKWSHTLLAWLCRNCKWYCCWHEPFSHGPHMLLSCCSALVLRGLLLVSFFCNICWHLGASRETHCWPCHVWLAQASACAG